MTADPRVAAFLGRCREDPVFFSQRMLGVTPHPGQEKFLREAREYFNVLVPGNRYGKSTVIALRHLWHAFGKVGTVAYTGYDWKDAPYRTISVSHSADQAEIVFDMVQRFSSNPVFRPFVRKSYATPFPTLILANGSEITCRSAHDGGKYIDGHAYRYVSIDEAGWIPDLKTLITNVILMRLAGGGMIDLIGTPKGVGSGLYWYANRAKRGVEGYYWQRGSVFDNPYLSAEDVKRRDELLGHADPRLREQVIYGEFVSTEGLAFTQDELDRLFDPKLPAHQDRLEDHVYYQAWDLGRKSDATVGMTFDITTEPYRLVDYQRFLQVSWEGQYDIIRKTAKAYDVRLPRIDSTGPQGDVIEEELWKRGIMVDGFKISTGAIKTNLINNLQSALSYKRQVIGERDWLDEAGHLHRIPDLEPPTLDWGLLRMPSIPQLLDEFGVYSLVDDKDLVQDSVMCAALAVDGFYKGAVASPIEGGLYG